MMTRWSFWATVIVSVLNILLGVPGVFEAPGIGLRVFIAITVAAAALVIVLVMLRPRGVRSRVVQALQALSRKPPFPAELLVAPARASPLLAQVYW